VWRTPTLTETKERQQWLSTVNGKLLQNGGAHCIPPQSVLKFYKVTNTPQLKFTKFSKKLMKMFAH
jgi:hypothetical protein